MKFKDIDKHNVVLTFSDTSAVFEDGKGASNKNSSKGCYLYEKRECVPENYFKRMKQWKLSDTVTAIVEFKNAAVHMIHRLKYSPRKKLYNKKIEIVTSL